jgi:hypothetical protein
MAKCCRYCNDVPYSIHRHMFWSIFQLQDYQHDCYLDGFASSYSRLVNFYVRLLMLCDLN